MDIGVGDWLVVFPSAQRVFVDVVLKTGALLIRPRYIDELKVLATIERVKLGVKSPRGIEKLASSYVVVGIQRNEESVMKSAMGLFEYAYGALRLVAVDNKDLAERDGNEIIAFFEAPLTGKSQGIRIQIFEPVGKSK
jgi:hypothetical protein